MRNIAIITARAGSKSIRDKNVYAVGGAPLIAYPIRAAQAARRIERVYISTDGESIAAVARQMDCEILWRPAELSGDDVNHGDVIKHAVDTVAATKRDLENIVVLLGNTVMIEGALIDQALELLEDRSDLDSVMTVWEAADDHPMRALEIVEDFLRPYGDPNRQASTDRHSYPKAYFYDQGVWAFRARCVDERAGPNPWWWLGRRCYPIIRPWITGRDIHSHFDIRVAEWWLQQVHAFSGRGDGAGA